jgi:glycosyltransferase involved in cell wall biosynthesis
MARVCLITTGQPTTNPRLVKEADALVEAGYQVHVIASFWAEWAEELDKELLKTRGWTCSYVGGSPSVRRGTYLFTRGRHSLSHRLRRILPGSAALEGWSVARVLPELIEEAERERADLYIAHNIGALPAAVLASRKYTACVGFDAEDFHTGELPPSTNGKTSVVENLEGGYLRQCHYLTASSPLIAQAYSETYGLPLPETVLNVFPLADRHGAFRPTNPAGPLSLYWFSQTIGRRRGLEDVVRAVGKMTNRNVHLHLRGKWQTGFRAQLYRLAAQSDVSEKQIHVHEPASADAMVSLSSEFDIGLALELPVSLNKDLCISNKIFTYLLAGNAVAATHTQGQRMVLDQINDAAFGYEPGDFSTLAAKLKRWCDDRQALDSARRRAWQYAEQQFNWEAEKSKFLAVVERVLKGKGSEPVQQQVAAMR